MHRLLPFTLCLGALMPWCLPAAEPPSAPILRIEAGMHTATIKRISTDRAGRLALTASYDKTARLWELASSPSSISHLPSSMPKASLLRTFRIPLGEGNEGKLYACALSPDGALAAVGGWTGYEWDKSHSIYLFDTATGRLVRRLSGLPDVVNDLAFSPQGRFLAAVLGAGQGLRVWEVAEGREVGRDTAYGERDSYGVDWQGEERLVTTCYDGNLRLYALARPSSGAARGSASQSGLLSLLAKAPVKGGKEPFSARFSPDGRRIAVGFGDSTQVALVDGSDLSFLYAPDTTGVDNGDLSSVTWSEDGTSLTAGGRWASNGYLALRRWAQAGRGQGQDSVAATNTLMDLRSLPGGGILFAAAGPAWGVLSDSNSQISNLKSHTLGAQPLADYRDDNFISHFRLSADGTEVAFGFEQFGKSPAQFSVTERSLFVVPPSGGQGSATSIPDRLKAGLRTLPPLLEGLPVTDWKNTAAPKLAGQPLALERYEMSLSLAITRDASGFLLGTGWYLRSFSAKGTERWNLPAPSAVWAVNLTAQDQLAVAAYADGTIRWHRADTGQELLAFFPHVDRKRWVLWTPQGYYDCSPGAEDLIGWHVNRGKDQEADFFPAAKFREQFYRPDVISRVLETRDVAAALKAANDDAGRKAQSPASAADIIQQMAPPVIALASGDATGTLEVDGPSVTVRYTVRSAASPATRVRLLLNGRPLSVEAPLPPDERSTASVTLTAPEQDAILSVLAENRFAVSDPATLRLVRRSAISQLPTPISAASAALKPKVYLLAAGISVYAKNDHLPNLTYAHKDAQDFAAAFQRQEGGLYQKVEVKLLQNADATAGNILDGLDWLKKECTAKDIAILFLSGHGENDPELRYYFCPHDYDHTRRLRTGVGFEDIQKTLQSLPGKVLFFIDSCHAGNALGKLLAAKGGGVDINRVVNELSSAENGAVVFASSTGRQVSVEDEEWQNGAFTKAIVEGLDGKADLLRNGTITISSLETWMAERVKELSEGSQTPTVAKPQTVPDFPIGLKR